MLVIKGKRSPVSEPAINKGLKRSRTKKTAEQPQEVTPAPDTSEVIEAKGIKGAGKGKRTQGQKGKQSNGNVPPYNHINTTILIYSCI